MELAKAIQGGSVDFVDHCGELWALMEDEFGMDKTARFCLDMLYSEAVVCPEDHDLNEVRDEYRKDVMAACEFVLQQAKSWEPYG
ncbi:hypothetical protein ACERK3_09160 [Phycisphaerales bacterium AB-hyl4]|uniref:HEPN domain-containing protein n=1 Tax=Natronomicrosphaera hydrolytica TaxID=3242702 RepID=A0ABV4U557_9BACT